MDSTNTLLAPWTGPYGGIPDFDSMKLDDLLPAFDAAAADHLAELDAVAADPAPPTFANTIAAMERTGWTVWRVGTYYATWALNCSTDAFQALDGAFSARRAAYLAAIARKRRLYERVCAVEEAGGLPPAETRLVTLTRERLVRQGAALDDAGQSRYAAIETRLAELYAAFRANVLADEQSFVTLSEDDLTGLPEPFAVAAREAAAARGVDGWAIPNTRSFVEPFLRSSTRRDLREAVWRAFTTRGDHGDAHDNNALIVEVLKLRRERARLLGYDDFADYVLAARMAGNPAQVDALLRAVWPAARAAVRDEVAAMQVLADADGVTVAPWDYAFYAEAVRRKRYDVDMAEVSAHLSLERMVDGMFNIARRLFGMTFTRVDDVSVFHPDVTVYEVTRDGEHVGLFYFDPFARPGKRSGAWARSLRRHETVDVPRTCITTNNCNFTRPAEGEPALLSWGEATTLFHEFGHALHHLSSTVAYPTLSGGVRDTTELQSQLLERWLSTHRILTEYALRHDTGEPMPARLVERVRVAAKAGMGFRTTEYLASAFLDLALHLRDPDTVDVRALEAEVLADLDMPAELVARHRPTHFAHVFASEGYAVGYYGYLWADVLSADAAEAFAEAPGGFYDRDVATAAVDHLYAPQDSVDPAEAYRRFRGRDPEVGALLRARGFAEG